VVLGINERDTEFSRGTLYNSLLFISAEGEIMGVRRKLMPTHAERLVWGQGDGTSIRVFDTPIARVGGAICWEHWMPLSRFAAHALGEQIHVAAWPEIPDIHQVASRHYAFEGRCFVVCVGSYLTMDHVPKSFELRGVLGAAGQFGEDADEILPGGSGIIGPDGHWIVGPVAGEEVILYADVNLTAIGAEQLAFDAAGHYNRPDIFSLTIDTRRRVPFTTREDEIDNAPGKEKT
jgi:predicted amidohydrolase